MNLHRNMYLSPVQMSLYLTAFLVRSQQALQFWYVKLYYIKLNFGRENKCLREVRGLNPKERDGTLRFLGIPEFSPDPTSSTTEYIFVNIWLLF